MLALVLDGGNAYAAKRQAQNAADAGALAGATVMCKHHDADVGETAAMTYAVSNGAVNPPDVDASLSQRNGGGNRDGYKRYFFCRNDWLPTGVTRGICRSCVRNPIGVGVLPVAWSCRESVVEGDESSRI